MEQDRLRTDRIRVEIASSGIDLAICQLSSHVLMLSGYAPILGQSFVLFPAQGDPVLIVPQGEESHAREGWCPDVRAYGMGTLNEELTVFDAVQPIIQTVVAERGWTTARIGYEGTSAMVPASYSQVGFPSWGTFRMLQKAVPQALFIDVAPILRVLQDRKTPREIDCLTRAADIAALAFEEIRDRLEVDEREATIAATAEYAIQKEGRRKGAQRVQPFAHVMSGDRAARAYLAFNETSDRHIQPGDPVVVQLEVYVDGFWSEVTRTFFVGEPGAEGRRIYESCLQAQKLAFDAIHHGAAASDVDKAARGYLDNCGFGPCFRHGLGHGIGFQAISHLQSPRLYPDSTDTLLEGMVFNVEPGVYVHGWGGVRINDSVVARPQGADIITNIRRDLDWAIVQRRARA